MGRRTYKYSGPVYIFETLILPHWECKTVAVNLPKAKSNIMFRCKQFLGKTPDSAVRLPGKFILMDEPEKPDIDHGTQIRMKI